MHTDAIPWNRRVDWFPPSPRYSPFKVSCRFPPFVAFGTAAHISMTFYWFDDWTLDSRIPYLLQISAEVTGQAWSELSEGKALKSPCQDVTEPSSMKFNLQIPSCYVWILSIFKLVYIQDSRFCFCMFWGEIRTWDNYVP